MVGAPCSHFRIGHRRRWPRTRNPRLGLVGVVGGGGLHVAHAHTHSTAPTPPPLLRRRAMQPRPSSLRRSRDHGRSSRETDQDQDRRGEAVRSGPGRCGLCPPFSPHRPGGPAERRPAAGRGVSGLSGRDARGRTCLGRPWLGAALVAGPAALRAGLGATPALARRPRVRASEPPSAPAGRGGGGWPAAGRPWPARAGRRPAELGCEEAESTLAWPQVALRALKFRGHWKHGPHPEETVGSPVLRPGRLPDFGNWGVNLEHLRKLLPCLSPQSFGVLPPRRGPVWCFALISRPLRQT